MRKPRAILSLSLLLGAHGCERISHISEGALDFKGAIFFLSLRIHWQILDVHCDIKGGRTWFSLGGKPLIVMLKDYF